MLHRPGRRLGNVGGGAGAGLVEHFEHQQSGVRRHASDPRPVVGACGENARDVRPVSSAIGEVVRAAAEAPAAVHHRRQLGVRQVDAAVDDGEGHGRPVLKLPG